MGHYTDNFFPGNRMHAYDNQTGNNQEKINKKLIPAQTNWAWLKTTEQDIYLHEHNITKNIPHTNYNTTMKFKQIHQTKQKPDLTHMMFCQERDQTLLQKI